MSPKQPKPESPRTKLVRAAIVLASLGLIAGGAAWIYPPAGLVVPGVLIWITLSFGRPLA